MQPCEPTTTRNLSECFSEKVHAILDRIAETQTAPLRNAAALMAQAIGKGRLIYAFGSGHSQSVAIEFYYRAGGLATCDVIHEKTFGRAERLPGYACLLLDTYPVSAGDVIIIISNSGRNPLPVEMAESAKQRGMGVIGITSLEYSRSVTSRAPCGKRLFEICDVVIDNCCPPGDALIDLGDGIRVGGASTLAGAFISQTLVCLTSGKLQQDGIRPPVFLSMNMDEGDKRNQAVLESFRARVRGL